MPGALLDERAPEIDQPLGVFRRLLAGEPFADDQRHRLFERRVAALANFTIAGVLEAVLEHGAEVLRDAFHPAGADRLDTRLLDGVEDGTGLRRLRQQPAVHIGVMAGEPQRDRIGIAALDRGILLRKLARRLGEPHAGGGAPSGA